MARVIYGLNTNQYLSEILDKTESIKNLEIDLRDLNVIRDISADPVSLNKEDIRLISGLKSDIRAVLFSLRTSTAFFPIILSNAPIDNTPINNNIKINNQISATAYKYNYYDFDEMTIKSADISTSRSSSWSSFETGNTAPIFYGGDVEIIPTPLTGKSLLDASSLEFNLTPEPLIFEAQEPTHLIKIEVNGVEQEFYAMKGIPLTFDGFFRTANFQFTISRNSSQPRASLVLEYLDTNEKSTWENLTVTSVNFPDFKARPKRIKFYYNPARITRLVLPNMLISAWPAVVLPAITTINISNNDFKEMPDFSVLAPNLRTLDIFGNDLTRGQTKIANIQLQRLPLTIENININGCFSDSVPVDISSYTNLRSLNFNSSYTISPRNLAAGKRMTDTQSTPAISPSNLTIYNVVNQRYTKLHVSVTQAQNLQNINISNNNIVSDSNDQDISLVSTQLRNFNSSFNSHNLVNVSNRPELLEYNYSYGYAITGNSELGGTFQGCNKLQRITLLQTYITGNIGQSFAELPSLNYLDIRFTQINGKLTKETFKGSTLLSTLLIQGSRLGLQDNGTIHNEFVDFDSLESLINLSNLYIVGNRNIRGNLPNLSLNKNLGSVNIQATDFSGGLQNYNSLPLLRELIVRDCKLSQSVPAFDSKSIEVIRLEFNLLTSDITNPLPTFNCSRLRYFSINNNLLAGPIPSYANCLNLDTLVLSNNLFVGYTPGALELCTRLRIIDFSNCRLNREDIQQILADLRKNYDKNKRSGVRVNLLGNNYVLSDIINNQLAVADLNYLRDQGWSITI
jgi:hypothetical protein